MDRNRFDKFTERARKVLSLAQEEAQRFQHHYIDTEHLLLGLAREGEGVAANVLSSLGVELNEVRDAVEAMIGRADRMVLGEIGLTPRAKKVLELAVDEARRLNHHSIGTEHLLLGLVREGEGIAAGVLQSLGVNLEKVRTHTIQVLSQSGAPHVVSRSRFSQTPFLQSVMEVGNERFDTFTVQVSRVLSRAEEEAQRFQQNYIGTEHLLLALTRESKGVAASVLSNLGVELNTVRSTVEFILSEKAHIVPAGLTPREIEILRLVEQGLTDAQVASQLAISPYTVNKHLTSIYSKLGGTSRSAATRDVLELAVDEAQLLNHHYVGIEHLLLGLIREEKGIAAGVLESMGVTLEKARTETIKVLSQPALPQKMEVPPELKDALKALDAILREKEAALQQLEYERAAELRDREVNLRDRIARLEADWYRERDNKESGQEPGEEHIVSTQQPIQDDDDKVQELSQEEKDFMQTLSALSQDERDRFDTLTVRARRVLRFSREEAQRFQHNYIGTEHLLLGLVREHRGIAAAVLYNLGVEINKVRSAAEFIIGRRERTVLGTPGLTPRAKKVIELAADEARRLNHDSIGTEHLLLGVVREGEGIAAGILQSLGVRLEKVRTETIRVLNQQKNS